VEQQTDGRLGSWFKCFWRGYHDPKRHPLGGFRCRDCRVVGLDMESMGFEAGHVSLLRRVFSRTNAEFTRTHGWEPGPGGY
jgi:hypothetical protein